MSEPPLLDMQSPGLRAAALTGTTARYRPEVSCLGPLLKGARLRSQHQAKRQGPAAALPLPDPPQGRAATFPASHSRLRAASFEHLSTT